MRGIGRARRRLVFGFCAAVGLSVVVALAAASGSGAATSPALDNFQCYLAASTKTAAVPVPFPATPSQVSLNNKVSAGSFSAAPGAVQLHCAPVKTVVNSGGHVVTTPISNRSANLLCRAIAPKSTKFPMTITLANQFGTGTLNLTAVRSLCMPSWESATAPALPKAKAPTNLDSFVCYTAASPKGSVGFKAPSTVKVTDQFLNTTATIGAPDIVCLPTTEAIGGPAGSKLVNAAHSSVCFAIAPAKAVAGVTVFDKNQFGTGGVRVARNTQLCVPSVAGVPPTTTTTAPPTTTTAPGVVTNYTDLSVDGPYDIATGPDGNLWFTDYIDSTISKITPQGQITNYPDATISRPDGIARGNDGAMWFGNTGNSSIGRIDTGGTVSSFQDPRIATPYRVTPGPDGNEWFTNGGANSVGSITPSGGVTTYNDGTIFNPQGITAGPDGALWFCNFYGGTVGRVTTSGSVSNFTDPTMSFPLSITTGSDGALWFTNPGNNSIGRITPQGVVTNFTNGTISSPIDITTGSDGALWFTNYSNNSIGRITTSGVITNYTDPTISSPDGIAAGPDGAIWFTNAGNDSIGRISV